ncbi:hypothetical protein BGZ47_008216 [Haplosporangium gracile]|nr:hypothetical protein BGZ47_008216 [Haplosporangium gracile]
MFWDAELSKIQPDSDTLAKMATDLTAQRSLLNRVDRTKTAKNSHHYPRQVNTSDTYASAQIKSQVRHANSAHDKV